MNRAKLKTYAPQARRDFIQAVTDRAAVFGLTKTTTEPITQKGDVAIIGGRNFPTAIAERRRRLEDRISRLTSAGKTPAEAFGQVMEAIAYTWFNRLVAIRYMEIHGYLDHGFRVLSHKDPAKATPEILEHAQSVVLPGLDTAKVIDLKLDGTKEPELYQMLLIAQCNALSGAMPFLFERIDDETELLLPDNLLNSDSLIRKLVAEIDEEDWQEVEIIGWLYQFYISDKMREVIGKVVKSEDIPAATQLFTPNWIVKYLVQNSLGRKWLSTYPASPLRQKMAFYIEPAEQTPEVQAQLRAITPESLNPEELTMMDPACGSGHILVEGYDLLKEIYLERGYRLKDIPKLILTKNLFGLDIDDRAAQLAAFALLMKARADDRRLFDATVPTNVLAIQESNGLNVNAIVQAFTDKQIKNEDDALVGEFGFMTTARSPLFATENRTNATVDDKFVAEVKSLFALFENAKVYGSLIEFPVSLAERLPALVQAIAATRGDKSLAVQYSARTVCTFTSQALMLAGRYDAVITNPPYMGNQYMNVLLKRLAGSNDGIAKADLSAMFVLRSERLAKPAGVSGFVTPYVWMFISSYQLYRQHIETHATITSLLQLEYNAFEPACVPVCAFTILNHSLEDFKGDFIKLSAFRGHQNQAPKTIEAIRNPSCGWRYIASAADFSLVPGCPIAYWISPKVRELFRKFPAIGNRAKKGLSTGDNSRFIRLWHEVDFRQSSIGGGRKWFPVTKGGRLRRWYGNLEYVLNYENDGADMIEDARTGRNKGLSIKGKSTFFLPGITWNDITICNFSARYVPSGTIPTDAGPMIYGDNGHLILSALNSCVNSMISGFLSPTFHFTVGVTSLIPIPPHIEGDLSLAKEAIAIAKADWDDFETSWDFLTLPLFQHEAAGLQQSQEIADNKCQLRFQRMKVLEQANNRLFIDAYGLQAELLPDVSDDQITLYRPDREQDIKRLLSFALGCMMGRYSLDKPGLIYANSGSEGFEASQYKTFLADSDGIIPITEIDWFADSADRRFEEFVGVAWPKEHLEENLTFVGESLGPKGGEQARDTIRRYFADDFYKDHLQTYKRRPIYWMFNSGKLGAFQCLVYLHRYNEGTLARMRTEYVIPLQGKINARIDQLEGDKGKAAPIHRKRLQKEQELLKKQQVELVKFDEKLRHYADMRIKLDLDDGVKVNYAKFGDLLANVTQVCGKGEDDE